MWYIILIVFIAILFLVLVGLAIAKHSDNKYVRIDKSSIKKSANEKAGLTGEDTVNYHLHLLIKDGEHLLTNILVPLKNGNTTEIDSLLITRKGIFCVETKNWVGNIIGNDENEYWYQQYDDPYKSDREHKNPVKQNQAHAEILERYLSYKYVVNNVVIFVNLENSFNINSNYSYSIRSFKEHYYEMPENELSQQDVDQIYDTLKVLVATQEQLDKHKEEIRNKYQN